MLKVENGIGEIRQQIFEYLKNTSDIESTTITARHVLPSGIGLENGLQQRMRGSTVVTHWYVLSNAMW